MKLTKTKTNKGMTLIELTVVILVLLSLISVLFIGARAWMRGSDRANAALLIRNAQQGVRSHANIRGIESTDTAQGWAAAVGLEEDDTEGIEADLLANAIFGPGRFLETDADGMVPTHPDNDNAFVAGSTDFETLPALGELYMTSEDDPAFFAPDLDF